MGFLSNLFDPGKENREAAEQLVRDAQFTGGSFAGPGGIGGSIDFTGGRGRISTDLGTFGRFIPGLQGQADFGFGLSQRGLGQGLRDLAGGAISDLQGVDLARFANLGGAAGLQQMMGASLGTAIADPMALGAGVTSALRGRRERGAQNLVNTTFDRLFASGGLSNQLTREQVSGDLRRQLADEDLGFQMAGLEAGRGLQQDAVNRLMAGFGGLEQFGSRMFGEGAQQAALNAQLAQQRFGIGEAMQNMQLQQMLAGQQVGLGALQGSQQLSQLPLAFMAAQLQAQGLRSDAALGGAHMQQQIAQTATSPFLGALGAIGQFGSAIGGFGGLGSMLGGLGGIFGGGGVGAVGGLAPTIKSVGSTPSKRIFGTSTLDPFGLSNGGLIQNA